MNVAPATEDEFDSFIGLAADVEDLFGPMVHEASFHGAVRRSIRRGTALLAQDHHGTITGGLLFSHHHHPTYTVGWLVVTEHNRSGGIGKALLGEAFRRWVRPPCVIEVVTFGPDHPGARFRGFYERLGFEDAEITEDGPEGGSRQIFRLVLDDLPSWALRDPG